MSNLNFVIPVRPEELIQGGYGHYTVREVLHKEEITKCLKAAFQCFRDEGPSFILENFDVYFSVIQLHRELPRSTVYSAYEDLRKALTSLPNVIDFLLAEDEENLTNERKLWMQTIIKMLSYLFVTIVQTLEGSDQFTISDDLNRSGRAAAAAPTRGRKKATASSSSNNIIDNTFKCNWHQVVTTCKNLLQVDLNQFWEAPGADALYTNLLAEICYIFLENAQIKYERETMLEIWNCFGLLITNYHVDDALIMRLVRLVKENEHVSSCLPDGVLHLIENFNCRSLLNGFVKELTEWQVTDTNVESTGSRFCSKMLIEMAIKMPEIMLNEIIYLNIYLKSDSYQLRNMVLSVQVEVLLANLTKAHLTQEERELRNDILYRLERFTGDSSSQVRTKCFTHITRLQMENAIPLAMVKTLLRRAVDFLHDATASCRKAAAHCVTTMLKYNIFGPTLALPQFQNDLAAKRAELMLLKYEIFGLDVQRQEEIEREWIEVHLEALKVIVCEQIEQETEPEPQPPNQEVENNNIDEAIRIAIREKNYLSAFKHCQRASRQSPAFIDLQQRLNTLQESDLYVCFMHVIFSSNVSPRSSCSSPSNASSSTVNGEQLTQLTRLETNVDFLADACEFLRMMHEALTIVIDEMLNSQTLSDMHEAVDFIITANQFKLDGAVRGILEILKIMQRNEEDRRKIVTDALKTVYLLTDSNSLLEHTTQVVERLIDLLQSISYQQIDAFTSLMSQWTALGILSNDIFDTMWKYFLRSIDNVTPAKSRAALILLRMAAQGRYSIIEKNYRMVAHICFGERARDEDLLIAVEGLNFLLILSTAGGGGGGGGSVNTTNTNANNPPPFRIGNSDRIWVELLQLVEHYIAYGADIPHVNNLLVGAVRFVFKLSPQPFPYIVRILEAFLRRRQQRQQADGGGGGKDMMPAGMLIRYNLLVGEIALSLLIYLDSDVYKEMKRRQHILNEQKNHNQHMHCTDVSTISVSSVVARRRKASANVSSSTNTTINEGCNSNNLLTLDDSMMDGADAIDADADYIVHILEDRCIAPETCLGRCYTNIVRICNRPDLYPHRLVQSSACTALLRGMLVSADFAETHIRLVFTLLAKTEFVDNKLTILMHMSDLLEKCPNAVEPYTPKLYALLDDSELCVREMAIKILSLLILKDMIRPQEHIWKLAKCIVDPSREISEMAKAFFVNTSAKSNNLYNYLPDIFTHLCDDASTRDADSSQLRITLKYLFALIDKPKQIENLVERFCLKYENTTHDDDARQISYVLSLMPYNDRALEKLIENFPKYKHFVLIDEVYANLKAIITQCLKVTAAVASSSSSSRKDMKTLTGQLEELINGMFDLNEGRRRRRRPILVENNFKRPTAPGGRQRAKVVVGTEKKKPEPRTRTRRMMRSCSAAESSSDDDDEPVQKKTRNLNVTARTTTPRRSSTRTN